MFRVTLPSNVVYVSPEQLPRFLANVAETRYVTANGELLQTTSEHSLVTDMTTATIVVKSQGGIAIQERNDFREKWQDATARIKELEDDLGEREQELASSLEHQDHLNKLILRAKKKAAKLKRK